MFANGELATLSDLAYKSAVAIYLVALILSGVYYAKVGVKKHTEQRVIVGAGGPPVDESAEAKSERLTADQVAGMITSVMWLGIIIHAVSVVARGLSTGRIPWGNLYEYISGITVITMLVAAIVIGRRKYTALWPWLLVPMIALMFFGGTKLYAAAGPVTPALESFWLPFHVSTVAGGAAIGIFSGLASLLYVFRTWQAPGQEHGALGVIARPLPKPAVLDSIAYKLGALALPVFGLGILLGAIWAESAWGHFWQWDPKETISLVTWVMYAAYLHVRSTPSWAKFAPWINVLALATMLFNLFAINLVVSGMHSYAGLN
ncbi:MAG: c-type cytochrome biogenesis protein CcsB [Corynebacterium sp.]|nr:c-type cytochrome biogenesis protein CcsB [Corynebacterium sp.]